MSSGDREQRIADLLAELHDRRIAGEPTLIEAYCQAHPDLAEELRAAVTGDAFDMLDAAPPLAAAPVPESLSGYRIVRELMSGGMGRVFLAVDPRLGREVAIKTLQPRFRNDATIAERFLNEARALARISHPHIVRIYGLGAPGEEPHFAMEYVPGEPLNVAAARLPLERQVEILSKVARAVAHLHENELLHRDLKPANVIVGSNLEPKLLDLGLALPLHDERRLTREGQVAGTPAYLAPEQEAGGQLDARTDVFALGVIFYELLTGVLPRRPSPDLPSRLNPALPGPLQNICLKCIEPNPDERYASATALAEDLDRFLAGEPVLAAPAATSRLMETKRSQHVAEIDAWHGLHLVSDGEYDALRRGYARLEERDDASILELRRLTFAQVSLYLGGWLLLVAGASLAILPYSGVRGWPACLIVLAVEAPVLWFGAALWRSGDRRNGIAFLLSAAALLPVTILLALLALGAAATPAAGREWITGPDWRAISNAQLWWALALALPGQLWLRRFTGSPTFSAAIAVSGVALSLVTLLRMGLIEWLKQDPGRVYFHLLPVAALFFAVAFWLERRHQPLDSRYFYPFAVGLTYVGLSGVALFHEPYRNWLNSAFPWTRGQEPYLFLINAGVYTLLQVLCDRVPTAQMRTVAKSFRFVLPGHVLISLLVLGMNAAEKPVWRMEAKIDEVLLPLTAACFVFMSIRWQMKNFFFSGLVFVAIGLVRLQRDLLRDAGWWPPVLLAAGLTLLIVAARYPALRRIFLRATAISDRRRRLTD